MESMIGFDLVGQEKRADRIGRALPNQGDVRRRRWPR
jgi:hypothetical protein